MRLRVAGAAGEKIIHAVKTRTMAEGTEMALEGPESWPVWLLHSKPGRLQRQAGLQQEAEVQQSEMTRPWHEHK